METNKQPEESKRSIELRSEKVRNIVGQIPPILLRYGIIVICMVLFILAGIASFLPYKETIVVDVTLHTVPASKLVTATTAGTILLHSQSREVVANQTVGYIQDGNKLVPIQVPISGSVVWNVSNGEQTESGATLLVVVPQEVLSVYGEALLNREQLYKVRLENRVMLLFSQGESPEGRISEIYPIPTDGGMNRIRIDFQNTNKNKMAGTQLVGKIIVSESTILKKMLISMKLIPSI